MVGCSENENETGIWNDVKVANSEWSWFVSVRTWNCSLQLMEMHTFHRLLYFTLYIQRIRFIKHFKCKLGYTIIFFRCKHALVFFCFLHKGHYYYYIIIELFFSSSYFSCHSFYTSVSAIHLSNGNFSMTSKWNAHSRFLSSLQLQKLKVSFRREREKKKSAFSLVLHLEAFMWMFGSPFTMCNILWIWLK